MHGDERESPRDAIRSWLDGTERESPKSRRTRAYVRQKQHQHGGKARHHPIRQASRSKSIGRERAATFGTQNVDHRGDRNQKSYGNNVEEPEHGSAMRVTSNTSEVRTHRHTARHTMQRLDEPGLAEKLGLHAPFRTFRDGSGDDNVDLDALSRPRKRRRHESPTGSFLEPAEFHEQTNFERDACSPMDTAGNGRSRRVHRILGSSIVALPSLEKPAETYEKRPRHKTREDRYELKEGNSDRREKKSKWNEKDGKDKKHKKHKRKEKSGAALMRDFSAQNVSHDRLTLQPSKRLGLFGRGRASSPIRRRGLPDLAFSEMSFLNSRQPKPAETAKSSDTRPAEKSKRRKSTKAADTEAEISRYFTSTKAPDQYSSDLQDQQKQRDSHRRSLDRDSPPDLIDLPSKPFLGFGSCGISSVSPAKRLGSPVMRDFERRLTRSPTRSTSYLTWSQSGALSQLSSRREKHRVLPLESTRFLNRKGRSSKSRKSDASHANLSSSHVEKIPVQKRRSPFSVTPERNVRSRSGHCRSRSRQVEAKASGGIKHRNQDEEREGIGLPLGPDRQRSVEDASERKQAHASPDLHHSNSASPPADDMLGNRDEPNARAMVIPRPSDLAVGECANPLDTMLEALLHDARTTDNRVELAAPRISDFIPNHTGHVEVTNAARMHHHPCIASPGHGALSHAGSTSRFRHFVSTPGSQIGYAIPYSRPGHESELSRTQRSMHSTPQPHFADYTPNLPPSPNSKRVDSRSTWNRHGEMYERQQLELPTVIDHHQHLANDNNENDGGDGMSYGHLPPFLQPPVGYHNDHTGSGFDEGHGMLPLVNAGFEEEAHLGDSAWDEAEENLFTGHDGLSPSDILAHGCDNRYQEYDPSQKPQYQTEPATATIRPDISRYLMPGLSKSSVANPIDVSHSMEETAPSGFWTPHKLY